AEAARKLFLHACTYHRAPLFLMRPTTADFRPRAHKMRQCFRQAAGLFDPPIESIEVPFGEHRLPGYAWHPAPVAGASQPLPTLLVLGGIETFAEDCYFMVAAEGPRRGYTVITADLPGQGFLPDEGLQFGAQMERPLSALVDYALTRPDVDCSRLAVFGFSWGGHIVFKGARYEPRLAAVIANPPMPDVFRGVLGQQQGQDRKDPISRLVFDQIVWRMGLRISWNPRDIAHRFGKAYDYYFHGKVDPREIDPPMLLLAGEDEAPVTLKIARETYDKLPNSASQLRIFTREEGGAAHCQIDNLGLPNGVMFDWLAEVLG
ncbi:MAG TPA: alpha/beta fold hydrolase, partial [Coriobacteriia bacterium]|nr:alpha/beta fold hydrolase [Coriobacteriia bacterium]